MKKLLFVLLLGGSMVAASCSRSTCYPTRGSRDYAWKVDRVENAGASWIVYAHRFEGGARIKQEFVSQCQPHDSIQKGKLLRL